MLEIGGAAPSGHGRTTAEELLDSGAAYSRFEAICRAQGSFREPPTATLTRPILARHAGRVSTFDNRQLARVAKLAGAPVDVAAGVQLHVRVGTLVQPGQPLFTVHAESPGELHYALTYLSAQPSPIHIEETS